MYLCVPISFFGETLCKSVYIDQGRISHVPPLTSSSYCEPGPEIRVMDRTDQIEILYTKNQLQSISKCKMRQH